MITPLPIARRTAVFCLLPLAWLGFLAGHGPPEQAEAGTFTVRQCGDLLSNGFSATFARVGPAGPVTFTQGCREGGAGRAGLYQDRSGRAVPVGAGGQYLFTTPPEVGLGAVTVTAALRESGGFRPTIVATGDGAQPVRLEEDSPTDGAVRRHRWITRAGLRDRVSARLSCIREAGCENSAGAARAFLEIHGVELEARDRTAPDMTLPEETGEWVSGRTAFDFVATDQGSGLSSVRAEVNGFPVSLSGPGRCDGLGSSGPKRLQPCVSTITGAGLDGLATGRAPFREGRNTLRVCATDFAQPLAEGNETCSPLRPVRVDNLPPARPGDVRTTTGRGWSPEPEFDLSWRLPADTGSPLDRARYELVGFDSAGAGRQVETGEWKNDPTTSTSRGLVRLPEVGVYRLDLRLRDRAGNLGPGVSTALRFDDRPPTATVPEPPPEWLSAHDLPYRPRLARSNPGGPSGVAGYALALAGADGPEHPCRERVCLSDEIDLPGGPDDRVARFESLPEGRSWLTAVAVSGAGVPSGDPGTEPLDVDLTPPDLRLEGLGEGWSNEAVELRAVASDELSGMEASPGLPGPPVTTIVAADGRRSDSPGNRTELTVRQEGETMVEFFARDLAGNVNDGQTVPSGRRNEPPGQAVVRIDQTAPVVGPGEIGMPGDPELVRIGVEDRLSGVSDGRIGLIPAGGGPVTWLSTSHQPGTLEARIPSDDLPEGRYLVSAEVFDRAGNRRSPSFPGESPGGDDSRSWPVQLPLKEPVEVSLGFSGRPASQGSLKVGRGSPVRVIGQVGSRPGSRPDSILVTESFSQGAPVATRSTQIPVTEQGSFVAKLEPGPSRTVRATLPGSLSTRRSVSRPLDLSVSDEVTFSVTPGRVRNGARVVMRGRVSGGIGAPSSRGKQVTIEFFDPVRKTWRPVALVGADASGRFRFAYRFKTIISTQRILFRARSLPEAGWPYAPSASAGRQVVVRPRRGP